MHRIDERFPGSLPSWSRLYLHAFPMRYAEKPDRWGQGVGVVAGNLEMKPEFASASTLMQLDPGHALDADGGALIGLVQRFCWGTRTYDAV